MTSHFASRNFWKQPMTGSVAPRKYKWPAMRASNMHIPAGGTCRNGGHANIPALRQTNSPGYLTAGDSRIEEVSADVGDVVGRCQI
jgi:hypothetical protein